MGSGWMAASVPPATTTSARPARSMSRASAIASAPLAHADTGAWTPARALSSRPTVAAGPLGMSIGTVCGETRRAPRSRSTSYCASRVSTPPMPLATATASRSGSTVVVSPNPASAHASRAAPRKPFGLNRCGLPEPGVGPCLPRGDERKLLRPVERAGFDPVQDLGRLDRGYSRDLHRKVRGPVRVEPSYTRPSGQQRVPGAGDVTADRRGGTESGDDDIGHTETPAFSM